jgi:hypothetical protein
MVLQMGPKRLIYLEVEHAPKNHFLLAGFPTTVVRQHNASRPPLVGYRRERVLE